MDTALPCAPAAILPTTAAAFPRGAASRERRPAASSSASASSPRRGATTRLLARSLPHALPADLLPPAEECHGLCRSGRGLVNAANAGYAPDEWPESPRAIAAAGGRAPQLGRRLLQAGEVIRATHHCRRDVYICLQGLMISRSSPPLAVAGQASAAAAFMRPGHGPGMLTCRTFCCRYRAPGSPQRSAITVRISMMVISEYY